MISIFCFILIAYSQALKHNCIHDRIVQNNVNEKISENNKRKRQTIAEIPTEYSKIRVKLDFTFLDAAIDANGICTEVGQWAHIGSPPTATAAEHEPKCEHQCDTIEGQASGQACSCWYQCQEEDILYAPARDALMNDLFPRAVAYVQSTLSVLSMPLTLTRNSCGCADDRLPLDIEMKQQYRDYTEHDIVLFVTARSNRWLANNTLAYACSCQTDVIGRPTFGHINWGANQIDFRNGDQIAEQVGVAVHEITHALGFAVNLFDQFLDVEKLPSERSVDREFEYPRVDFEKVVRATTITAKNADGEDVQKLVNMIVSPNTVEQARTHFGCPSLQGVELEDFGSSGSANSHWEKRMMDNEYMTSSSSFDPVRSAITLGLLQDSGWYKVNYTGADRFLFGGGLGCDFVEPRCDKRTGPYTCGIDDVLSWGCTFSRHARGVCTNTKYSDDVPEWNRLFPGEPTFGGSQSADFCPMYGYTSNLKSDCRRADFQAGNLLIRGEHFSESARCLDSTLLHITKQNLKGSGGCFTLRCVDGKLFARIANEFLECKPGEEISVADYNGHVTCPSAAETEKLCAEAPQIEASAMPTLTDVSPSSGSAPTTGQRFTLTGTGLRHAVRAFVGSRECSKLIGTPTDTKLTCEIVVVTDEDRMADADAEQVMDEKGNLISSITNIFNDNPESDERLKVVIELDDGLTATKRDAYTIGSSSASTALTVDRQLLLGGGGLLLLSQFLFQQR